MFCFNKRINILREIGRMFERISLHKNDGGYFMLYVLLTISFLIMSLISHYNRNIMCEMKLYVGEKYREG